MRSKTKDKPFSPQEKLPIKDRYRGSIIAINSNGQVLFLIKARTNGKRPILELPGGGIKHNETSREAARRELFEECGVRIQDSSLLDNVINQETILFENRRRRKIRGEISPKVVEMTQNTKFYITVNNVQLSSANFKVEDKYAGCIWLSLDEIGEQYSISKNAWRAIRQAVEICYAEKLT